MAGFVYVMSNPAFPNLLKIGKSSKDPSEYRTDELYTTGVPFPFECEYYIFAAKFHWLERAVHDELASLRANQSREFFEVNCNKAVQTIQEKAQEIEIGFEKFLKEPSGNNFDKNQSPKTDSFLENFRAEEVLKQKNTDIQRRSIKFKYSGKKETIHKIPNNPSF